MITTGFPHIGLRNSDTGKDADHLLLRKRVKYALSDMGLALEPSIERPIDGASMRREALAPASELLIRMPLPDPPRQRNGTTAAAFALT
ncbi:hypothetical protein [Sphingomonas albertensis]|uniref:Uncharacterized protein n=1 Tax=Sphingomonas albertensis TaxID=2762591 RepID=A0ABR7ALN6_9SPHN|nr:hypothetical protein [Sphingomonas albertensis]MBC3941363.1 hypothetical protein [Sphingomonas albertensis]